MPRDIEKVKWRKFTRARGECTTRRLQSNNLLISSSMSSLDALGLFPYPSPFSCFCLPFKTSRHFENANSSKIKPSDERFRDVKFDDIDNFLKENENENTRKKTTSDMNLFGTYLVQTGEKTEIENLSAESLNEKFSTFLLSVRKKDGSEYEPTSDSLIFEEFAFSMILKSGNSFVVVSSHSNSSVDNKNSKTWVIRKNIRHI
jgi:hypothetical protein